MLSDIIYQHLQTYPQMMLQDLVKLIYQNEFAGGHLIKDPQSSLEYLSSECKDLTPKDISLFEDIGNNLVRINLVAVLNHKIDLDKVNDWFVLTANSHQGDLASFKNKLALWTQLELPFSKHELVQYLSEYARKGYPAVHHSQIYAKLYQPHYRVIDFKYLSEVPVEKVR